MGFLFDWLVFNSREVIASCDFRSRPTMSLRGPLGIYTDERSEFMDGMDGMGWMGWDGMGRNIKSVL